MNSSMFSKKRHLHGKKVRRKYTKMFIVVMSNFYLLLSFSVFSKN